MTAKATISAIRFGTGLSPRYPAPADADALMAGLDAPDEAARRFPVQSFEARRVTADAFQTLRRQMKSDRSDAEVKARLRAAGKEMDAGTARDAMNFLSRGIHSPAPLRERLTWFWADHFTVRARPRALRGAVTNYVEDAIRPHVAGRFGAMLRAVATHPMMLEYLDQSRSFGPNSPVGLKKGRGVNENLAREMLELHTLGVGGPYEQQDVKQMALLLTGLYADLGRGFTYRRNIAEPGTKTVMGQRFGGKRPAIEDIHAALEMLARHPATARHLARKLAVHFLGPAPPDDLIEAMAGAYLAGSDDLRAMTAAMLDHPAAWEPLGTKARRPLEFIVAAYRALDPEEEALHRMKRKDRQRRIFGPLSVMGQPFQQPSAPNGWPEEDEAWITPQAMAARIQWAMAVPSEVHRDLPDPRLFLETALADAADGRLRFAVSAAETRWEGVGLVLASPAFNRR